MSENPLVGIVKDSEADWSTMQNSAEILDELGIANEARVISAHQIPARLDEYVSTARERGVKVIIAGAGKAAVLPGAAAASDISPRPRRANEDRGSRRQRQLALHLTDASWESGRHFGDRKCRRNKCRPICRHPGAWGRHHRGRAQRLA